MPYRVRQQGPSKFVVQVNHGGKWTKAGESNTREKAEASVRARHASEHERGVGKKK